MTRAAFIIALLCSCFAAISAGGEVWRSSLYPADWTPPDGGSFLHDAFLQDFSYAGYHRGEAALPEIAGPVFRAEDHGADPSGQIDSTVAIQAALDAAANAGGGVVTLGEGTFLVAPVGSANAALVISASNVVLRGAGAGRTFIENTRTDMRGRSVIAVRAPDGGNWRTAVGPSHPLTADVSGPSSRLFVDNPGALSAGEWIVVRADATAAFIEDLRMTDLWGDATSRSSLGGVLFYRQITAIDPAHGFLELDAPVRYFLRTRDNARITRTHAFLEETGLEHFSIGNRAHAGSTGWGEQDYTDSTRAAYDTHNSWLVRLQGVRNSWVHSVHSFQPSGNDRPVHMLSNGILLTGARGVTLKDVEMQRPQYGGGGGNGYMIRFSAAQECLAVDCRVLWNRHGFVFSGMQTSGNVILRGLAAHTAWQAEGGRTNGRGSDHHMHLSQSNLIDGVRLDGDFFQAAWRGTWGTVPHGLTATHSVYWNLFGERYFTGRNAIVESEQFGHGYIIGTRGPASGVVRPRAVPARTDPVDHLEGEGRGADLWPPSLYDDQFARRMGEPLPGPLIVEITPLEEIRLPEHRISLRTEISGGDAEAAVSVLWEQMDGRAAFIADPSAPATLALVEGSGLYRFALTVTRGAESVQREIAVRVHAFLSEVHQIEAARATFVRDGSHAQTSYGAASLLEVKNDGTGFSREAVVAFDLWALSERPATAILSMTSMSQGNDELEHAVFRLSAGGWTEDDLTWNTRPDRLEKIGEVTVRADMAWHLDVSAHLGGIDEGSAAFLIAATQNFGAQGWMSYAGRTHLEATTRPVLTVTTAPPGQTYNEWAVESPEASDPTADASGDGLANAFAYLAGANAFDKRSRPPLYWHAGHAGWVLRYERDPRAQGAFEQIVAAPTFSPDVAWQPYPGERRIVHTDPVTGALTIEVAPPPSGSLPLFFRLVVTVEE